MFTFLLNPYDDPAIEAIPTLSFSLKQSTDMLSPTLPMNFDHNLLPKDVCEKQFTQLSRCFIIRNNANYSKDLKHCDMTTLRFNQCKVRRDILIYDRIKNWEMKKFQDLTKQNKQLYLQGLKFKLQRLNEQYQTIPSFSSTQFIEKKISHEQAEVRWRIRYLEKL